ncbi:MAG: B12-binding domain-containing radical SAM protein [Pseudodesulfovibrio sp.]|uniref:Radical SAM domain protein n=1 Tax=Pseudodesulfovibrio aespoeensis (strain ATCC 700646 / DSM 10631 / Aspo-2) TaxID=643562 RepID=E6VZK6_PSEA9|nr:MULTISPECIES: radical SAM protein [Pseudodesulfovibrio]MBU4243366.1 B12-binding domain-containing radical SAM protein [Pseudomonadota bacterium]ADU61720.1 Radical SAM domain protein [Pseudodesulfovibrio aespoeensis Aspo-2]MBU4380443.1 B12-binding domain-containing radical SAM protein [Pseudomonadota bacterium]MBU4475991.1 B12-binding domain-containing radical SAM protein [Pseudomonadota bacterium]MBU4515764.1 B12-binding domain-containing radical SAM protein [Pseudomonadota bacterium]
MKTLFLKPPLGSGTRNAVRDFVYGCWCNGRRVGGMQMPPLNDLYVATHAREHGIESVFIDAQFEMGRYENLLRTELGGFGAVVILSSTQSFQADIALLTDLKRRAPQLRTILFGSHPTFMPQYCLSSPAVDFIVIREPEDTIRELLQTIDSSGDLGEVAGIGYRDKSGSVQLTPPRPFIDMDELPIPDRRLLPARVDYFNPVVKRMPYTTIQTSRGCPGKCIFCTAPEFYGKRIRCRSTDNVLKELHEIKSLGYREVFFRDETFTAYKKRNIEICARMVKDSLDLSWIANGRVDLVDSEALAAMKKAGCHMIKFGVETGSDEILRRYKKGTTAEQARQAFRYAKEVGLDTHAHLVVGGPGESEATLAHTIEFVKELDPTTASFGILTPYAGTELFEEVAAKHSEIKDGSASNMSNLHVSGFYSESVCGISGDTLSKWLTRCYRSFYLRPGYIWKRLRGIESYDELMTLIVAGTNIFHFSLSGKK